MVEAVVVGDRAGPAASRRADVGPHRMMVQVAWDVVNRSREGSRWRYTRMRSVNKLARRRIARSCAVGPAA